MQKFIDKWRYEIRADAYPGICSGGGLILRLETTSNDLTPDFDRFSSRLSRFHNPNLGNLQKKGLQKQNTVVLDPRIGQFSRT